MLNGSEVSNEIVGTIRKIIHAVDVHSKKLNSTTGITSPQLVILNEIKRNTQITTTKLAENISLSQSTATSIIDRLVEKVLVIRTRDEIDKRKWFLKLSETGNAIVDNSPLLIAQSFLDKFSSLPEWQQSQMLSSLQRIAEMLRDKDIKEATIEEALITN